MQNNLLTLL